MTLTTKDTAQLLALKQRLENLATPDRLRLCAELLDLGKYELVETLAGQVVDALRARRLLGGENSKINPESRPVNEHT